MSNIKTSFLLFQPQSGLTALGIFKHAFQELVHKKGFRAAGTKVPGKTSFLLFLPPRGLPALGIFKYALQELVHNKKVPCSRKKVPVPGKGSQVKKNVLGGRG